MERSGKQRGVPLLKCGPRVHSDYQDGDPREALDTILGRANPGILERWTINRVATIISEQLDVLHPHIKSPVKAYTQATVLSWSKARSAETMQLSYPIVTIRRAPRRTGLEEPRVQQHCSRRGQVFRGV